MFGSSAISRMLHPQFKQTLEALVSLGLESMSLGLVFDLMPLFEARGECLKSKDPFLKVGAVIYSGAELVAAGHTHFPNEANYSSEALEIMYADQDFRAQHAIRAETDALSRIPDEVQGTTIYVYPCQPCAASAMEIVNAKIEEVITISHDNCNATCSTCNGSRFSAWQDDFKISRDILTEHNVKITFVDIAKLRAFFPPLPDLPSGSFSPILEAESDSASADAEGDSQSGRSESSSSDSERSPEAGEEDASSTVSQRLQTFGVLEFGIFGGDGAVGMRFTPMPDVDVRIEQADQPDDSLGSATDEEPTVRHPANLDDSGSKRVRLAAP